MEIRKLEIRRIKEEELEKALHLVWEVFEKEIKSSYTDEGVREFLKFIDYNFMRELYVNGKMIFWGAYVDELIGTIAVRSDGHISLFFVKRNYQGVGIGKALFQMMYNYCVKELKVSKITVNAAPQSVAKYIHMGMRQTGNIEEKCGIRSVPMEVHASPALVQPVTFQPKKSKKKYWIIAVFAGVVLLAGAGVLGYNLYKKMTKAEIIPDNNEVWEDSYEDPYEEFYEEFFGDFYGDYYDDYYDDYYGEPAEEEPTYL